MSKDKSLADLLGSLGYTDEKGHWIPYESTQPGQPNAQPGRLGSFTIADFAALGEELLNPMATNPDGSGSRVLDGMPGRFQTVLQARESGRKTNAKRTPEERRRIAMLGVEARRKKMRDEE